MKNLFCFKRIFLLLLLSTFILPALLYSQQNICGRLWEYIYDPSNPGFTAQKNEVVNFMKENFDADNIPLISVAKLTQANGKLYGIDSVYKYSDAYAIGRWKTWYKYYHELKKWAYPWFNYRSYISIGQEGEIETSLLTLSGTSFNRATLDAIKKSWDSETIKPLIAITGFTTEIKDGFITGSWTAAGTDVTATLPDVPVVVNVILAEGYHKYGNEEHYFIPRLATNVSSVPWAYTHDFVGKQGTNSFKLPIDKSWNTKYLYAIAVLELYPLYPSIKYVTRVIADVAVDKPVDVRNAPQHTQLQLNVSHNTPAQKFNKVSLSASTDIVFKVENPTSQAVTAEVYIDSTTSTFGKNNSWTLTRGANTITVPANSSTNVTITAQAPATESVTAFDLAIRPINTANGVNPIISNALTVISTSGIKMLGLAKKDAKEDKTKIINTPFFANTYYEQFDAIPLQYYSCVDISQFEAYIMLAGNSYRYVAYSALGDPVDGVTNNSKINTIHTSLNANLGTDTRAELTVNDVLTEAQTKFLNSIISSGKHLALFTDRTGIYSTLASASEKTEFQALFTNFGVSFKDETYRLAADNNRGIDMPKAFSIAGTSNEELAEGVDISINNAPLNAGVAYTANWNITSTSSTSKVFSYSDLANSVAAVKTTKANSKLFLAGFGLEGSTDLDLMSATGWGQLFNNLAIWWFGEKVVPEPTIAIDQTSLDFGTQMVSVGKNMSIVISNTATNPNDVLTISSTSSMFRNTTDNSFSVVKLPQKISAGQKDTLILRFEPESIRQYANVTFSLESDATNEPSISIPCVGEGIENTNPNPMFSISEEMLEHNFNNVTVDPSGGATENFTIWFTNAGGAPLNINNVKFKEGTDTEVYTVTQGNAPFTVNKDDFGSITVQFSALKVGTFDGVLEIHSNDPDKPIVEVKLHAKSEPSGINEEIAKMFNCAVAPVPANDLLNIEFNVLGNMPRNVKLTVIDQTGKTLLTVINDIYTPNSYKQTVDVQYLPAGSYFLEYTIDNMRSATPFAIAR